MDLGTCRHVSESDDDVEHFLTRRDNKPKVGARATIERAKENKKD
jgi:hypothetical protein